MSIDTHRGLHVKCLLFLPISVQIGIYQQMLIQLEKTSFYKNPLSGARVDSCVRTDRQEDLNRSWTWMLTHLITEFQICETIISITFKDSRT
jgi:hypothetical protein